LGVNILCDIIPDCDPKKSNQLEIGIEK